jgi:PAS domain S-box-containing protein
MVTSGGIMPSEQPEPSIQKNDHKANRLRDNSMILKTVLDTIPNPVFYKDRDGRYQGCNNAFAEQILGLSKEAIIGRTLFEMPRAIPDHLARHYARQDAALFKEAGTQFYESEVQCADGMRRLFFFNKATFLDTRGKPAGIVGVMLDITEHKLAVKALRKSEERFRRFFEDVELGIFQSTREGHIMNVNPAFARMFGYHTPQDLLARVGNDASRLYVDPANRSRILRLITTSDRPVKIETRFRRRDKTVFTGDLHAWRVKNRDGRFLYLEGFIDDITDRKQFEKSLRESEQRLRFLSSKLLAAQEEERRRISMELHDDLGQNLAALKLQMQAMTRRLRQDQKGLKRECQGALAFIDRIIDSTRHLSRALNPSVIQDLKLCGTIRRMLRDFEKYAAVQTTLEMDDIDPLFSPDQQIIIYRILQEALHNIHKHARARAVRLTVSKCPREVRIEIRDDGRGFDIDQALNQYVADRGLGLAALEERSHMLGGDLRMTSAKGRGTCVRLTIPITGKEDTAP